MRSLLLLIGIALYIASRPLLGADNSVKIIFPPENYKTYDERIMISGKVTGSGNIKELLINGNRIPRQPGASFTAGLILKPGKNIAEIIVRFSDDRVSQKKSRIIRRIKFEDTDYLYEGQKHWARKKLADLATLGVIEAYPDGNFFPNNDVARGEFATWLAKSASLKREPVTEDLFYDVPKQHWRAPYIQAVLKAGFMKDKGSNYFGCEDPMKRSEAVQTALLAEGVPDVPIIGEYFDDQTIKQAVSYQLYLASENRLILGTSNQHQMFDPERNITRAEAAVLLSRLSALKSRLDSIDDWKTGFGRDSLCSVKALPVIIRLKVTPESVVADGKSSINIAAQIWDQDGPDGISIVKADLSSLGGAQETAMFDDATHGDTISNDLVYSTLFPVAYELTPGQKSISVTVVDRNGWQASSSVSFMVSPPNFPPQILSAIAFPSSVRPGGKSMIAVKVYDQNGPEDIASVRIDLSGLGQSPALDLEDSGKDGDFKAGDGIFMKEIKIPDNTKSATLSVPVTVTDRAGQKASAVISLDIR